ncbi:MAG: hypothetical protein ACYTEQ_22750 [Planctomycetota bacterium]|jgi:hypothetical protein
MEPEIIFVRTEDIPPEAPAKSVISIYTPDVERASRIAPGNSMGAVFPADQTLEANKYYQGTRRVVLRTGAPIQVKRRGNTIYLCRKPDASEESK